MIINNIQKISLIDYPEKLSAIIFTQGCNFNCPYCHNPELLDFDCCKNNYTQDEIIDFLKTRKGKLDAVVITGGEPTLQKDLIEFLDKIKSMNYLIKLDTNGSNPCILEKLMKLKLTDYFAMDIKAPLYKYSEVSGSAVDVKNIEESKNLIINSNIDYEFRTTVLKYFLSEQDLLEIAKFLKGAKRLILQKFVPTKILDENLKNSQNYTQEEFDKIILRIKEHIPECYLR